MVNNNTIALNNKYKYVIGTDTLADMKYIQLFIMEEHVNISLSQREWTHPPEKKQAGKRKKLGKVNRIIFNEKKVRVGGSVERIIQPN